VAKMLTFLMPRPPHPGHMWRAVAVFGLLGPPAFLVFSALLLPSFPVAILRTPLVALVLAYALSAPFILAAGLFFFGATSLLMFFRPHSLVGAGLGSLLGASITAFACAWVSAAFGSQEHGRTSGVLVGLLAGLVTGAFAGWYIPIGHPELHEPAQE
jgi:hypothetical protein